MEYDWEGLIKEIVKANPKVFIINLTAHHHHDNHIESNVHVSNGATLESINNGVDSLRRRGANHIASAFGELSKATESLEDSAQARESLELIEELVTQAHAKNDKRKDGLIRSCLDSLEKTFSAAGGLAAVWDTCGTQIAKYFGVL